MDFEKLKLGKQGYKHDDRTLMMAKFLSPDIHIPDHFNFDANRAPFPDRVWGNDNYGDCVIAARANATLRLERVEQRRTLAMVDEDAINLYKAMTGCQSPGDEKDTGLVMLEAMRQWRNEGWSMFKYPHHHYDIAAYGEIDPMNQQELRACIYMLGGVHFGFALPVAAQQMTRNKVWDYNGENGGEWQPGSWGGHAVYGIAYDKDSITIKTWGFNVKVTNAFIEKYCDEAWGVVDNLDSWRTKQTIDVSKLESELRQISSHVDG